MSDCLFCKIIVGELPSTKVYEDEQIVAINDLYPLAPVHILVVPKKHIPSLNEIAEEDLPMLGHILKITKELAAEAQIAESGYRVVTNIGKDGAQAVQHLHFHIMGGKPLGAKLG
ncbi:MAG: histidine triad nucleotide-binding protein [Peptococcaceae bacterium]|jgi:histidine triad (HIT) family protein|nr:histidine triad nucleotide-binding protein [Peptococcaceae bacterium]